MAVAGGARGDPEAREDRAVGRFAPQGVSGSNAVCSTIEHEPALLTDEYRYKILRLLEENPQLSQRDLADRLGVSLGKANYCLRALIRLGQVKARNFKNNRNRTAYFYVLTSKGIAAKARSMTRFLQVKVAEYEALQREIEQLRREQGGR